MPNACFLIDVIGVMSLLVHFQFTGLPDHTVPVIASFIVVVKYHFATCRRTEVLTTVNMETIVFRHVTPCTASFIPTPIYAPDYTASYFCYLLTSDFGYSHHTFDLYRYENSWYVKKIIKKQILIH